MSQNRSKKSGLFSRSIQYIFQIQEQEVGRVALMFLYSLTAVGAFILGRILRDTLLLALPREEGIGFLPVLMAISAVCVSLVAYTYSRMANRLRRDRMIILINTILAILLSLIYIALLFLPKSTNPVVLQVNYIFTEVMGSIQVIQFWTLASELFNPREAKRSFAIIGGGAVLANLLAFGIRPLIKILDSVFHIFPILIGMLMLCVFIVRFIGKQNSTQLNELFAKKKPKDRSTKAKGRIKMGTDSERVWSNRLLLVIAMIIVVTYLTTTLIDYQFKAIAERTFPGNSAGLAEYFGNFYGITGILCCVMQFGIASRLLARSGIQVALLLLPIALFSGSFLLATAPLLLSAFWAATIVKGSENVFRYTIYEVSMNLLYVPVSSHLRARAKTFIDGILKPASIGFASVLIALFKIFSSKQSDSGGFVFRTEYLSWIAVGLVCLWIYLIYRAHKEYVATLIQSMQKSRFSIADAQFSLQDETAVKAMRQLLKSEEPDNVLLALEIISQSPRKMWEEDLFEILEEYEKLSKIYWELQKLNSAAKKTMAYGAFGSSTMAYEALGNPPDDAMAFDTLDNKEIGMTIQEMAEVTSSTSINNHSNEKHEEVMIGVLKIMMEIPKKRDVDFRIVRLMKHPSHPLKAQAIETTCALWGEEAVYRVVPYLNDPEPIVRKAAVVGLIQHCGLDGILHAAEHLKKLLENEEPEMRKQGVEILGRLGVRKFYHPVLRLLQDSDAGVRASAIMAAGAIKAPELLPSLLQSLAERKNAPHAIRSLVSYGMEGFPLLREAFVESELPEVRKIRLVRIFSRFPEQEVAELLLEELTKATPQLRLSILKALHQMRTLSKGLQVSVPILQKILEEEIAFGYRWRIDSYTLERKLDRPGVLLEVFAEQLKLNEQIIFATLTLMYSAREIQLIQLHFEEGSGRMQAHAIELLDNLLSNEHKIPLMPLFEGVQSSILLKSVELLGEGIKPLDLVIQRLSQEEAVWLQACLVWTIGEEKLVQHIPYVSESIGHKYYLISETAALALEKLEIASNDETMPMELIKARVEKPKEPTNVTLARFSDMLSTIEKLLFLKRIELFEKLTSEELMFVVHIAVEEHFDKGEMIMVENEMGDSLFIIIEGKVQIIKGNKEIAVLGEREPVGEMSIIDSTPRSASVRAVTDVRMLKIEREAFHNLMAEHLGIALGIIKVLSQRLRQFGDDKVLDS